MSGVTAKMYIKIILPPLLFGYDLFTPSHTRGYVLAMKFVCQKIAGIFVRGGICLPFTPAVP